MPVLDETRPFGDPSCTSCQGICSGHFLPPEQVLDLEETPMAQPPSVILKEFFTSLQGSEPTDGVLTDVASKTLLPTSEVRIRLDHLKTVELNRKRGASRAAMTRRIKEGDQDKSQRSCQQSHIQRQQDTQETYRCGVCAAVFKEETDEEEVWVGCDQCARWFHAVCVNIDLCICHLCEQ